MIVSDAWGSGPVVAGPGIPSRPHASDERGSVQPRSACALARVYRTLQSGASISGKHMPGFNTENSETMPIARLAQRHQENRPTERRVLGSVGQLARAYDQREFCIGDRAI